MKTLHTPWPLGLSRRSWPILAGGLVALLAVLSLADVFVSRGLVAWPETIRVVFHWITGWGEPEWILLPAIRYFLFFAGLALIFKGLERRAFFQLAAIWAFIFIGIGLPGLVANLLKRLIGRARPLMHDDTIGSLTFHPFASDWQFQSFPSGHSTVAFAMVMVFSFLWPRIFPWVLGAGVLIAFSRVPENMHYPTDVLGGLVLGTLGAFAIRNFFASREWLFTRLPDGTVVRQPLLIAELLGFRPSPVTSARDSAQVPPQNRP